MIGRDSRSLLLRVALACAFATGAAQAGIVYVDANLTSGANDGTSWTDAFQGTIGLQSALAVVNPSDQIWIARGLYKPTTGTSRSEAFRLHSGSALYGGFAGGETNLAQRDPALNPTVLSGDLAGDDAAGQYGDNSLHVLLALNLQLEERLDGFTIEGGNANLYAAGAEGGALYAVDSKVIFANCTLRANRVAVRGGALRAQRCKLVFDSVRFLDNDARGMAGAHGEGGALYLGPSVAAQFEHCEFRGNLALDGAAIFATDSCDVSLAGSLVALNIASDVQQTFGAAVYAFASDLSLQRTTIAGNTSLAGATGGIFFDGGALALIDSVVYGNTGFGGLQGPAENLSIGQASVDVRFSCVTGGMQGDGNVNADPLLADPLHANFRLGPGSPCADAGSRIVAPSFAAVERDLDDAPRFGDDPLVPNALLGVEYEIDMGAYETQSPLSDVFCVPLSGDPFGCPCNNVSGSGHGCMNSDFFSNGGWLLASGAAQPDTVVLAANDVIEGASCLFLQSDSALATPLAFGDGVRCIGGALRRLAVKSATMGLLEGAASYPGLGDASISQRSAVLGDPIIPGSVRYYQVAYRDSDAAFCPPPLGGSWNVTNAVSVHW